MLVTPFGIVIVAKEEQLPNAPYAILVTLLGITTAVKEEQL